MQRAFLFIYLPPKRMSQTNPEGWCFVLFCFVFPWIWLMISCWCSFPSFLLFSASKSSITWGLNLWPERRSCFLLWTRGRSFLFQRTPGGVNEVIHWKLLSSTQYRSGSFHHWDLSSTLSSLPLPPSSSYGPLSRSVSHAMALMALKRLPNFCVTVGKKESRGGKS